MCVNSITRKLIVITLIMLSLGSYASDCPEAFISEKQKKSNDISTKLLLIHQGLYHALLQKYSTLTSSKIKKTQQIIKIVLNHNINLISSGLYRTLRSRASIPTVEQVHEAIKDVQLTIDTETSQSEVHTSFMLLTRSDKGVIPRDALRSLAHLLKQLPEDSPYYPAFEPLRAIFKTHNI